MRIRASKFVVVTDVNVWRHYSEALTSTFQLVGIEPLVYVAESGERNKTRSVKATIEDWMLEQGCHRDTCVVAFGGGVVGDLAGFVAGTFMRGVPFVNIPTTLLAMVDASVGGKTGIDTPGGKNMVGLFYQPKGVYADLSLLRTLPPREFRAGMAEVIKVAAIKEAVLFDKLEASSRSLLDIGESVLALEQIVTASIRVKTEVVSDDEHEAGLRKVLNFGHTIGHALEALLAPDLLHGEAVAIGMVKEAEIARAMGFCAPSTVERLRRCLVKFQLPTEVPQDVDVDACIQLMVLDKKNSSATAAAKPGALTGGVDSATPTRRRTSFGSLSGMASMAAMRNRGATEAGIKCVLIADIGTPVGAPYARTVPRALLRRILCRGVAVCPLHSTVDDDDVGSVVGSVVGSTVASVVGSVVDEGAPSKVMATVPGSKSLTNRMMLLAALAGGTTAMRGALSAADTMGMARCLRMFGASCRWTNRDGSTLVVRGTGGSLQNPAKHGVIDVGDAGTAARFVLALCALLPAASTPVTLTGSPRMQERPMRDLVDALRAQGVAISYLKQDGCLPVSVRGSGLPGGRIRISSSVSSQFVSAMLMVAPYAASPVELVLDQEHPTSLPFIQMTIACMKKFGVQVQRLADNHYVVPSGRYRATRTVMIEPDATSASYAMAMAAVTGRTVETAGIGSSTLQGDSKFAWLLQRMGCVVRQSPGHTEVTGPPPGVCCSAVM